MKNYKIEEMGLAPMTATALQETTGGFGVIPIVAGVIGLCVGYISLAKEFDDLGHKLGKSLGEAILK